MKEKKLNRILRLIVVSFCIVFFLSSCNLVNVSSSDTFTESLEEQLQDTYIYNSISDYTYVPSNITTEYYNFLSDDNSEKMFYDATVNLTFYDADSKNIHLYYGTEKYNIEDELRGVLFAHLDHPELEIMKIDSRSEIVSNKQVKYQKVIRYCLNYDEYSKRLEEVNSEISDLVTEVNETDSVITKYELIYNWITSNVTYEESEDINGVVEFVNGKMVLANYNCSNCQNIYGAIVEKKAVCDGIADSFKYICNLCDLDCTTILGYIGDINEEQYHAWNIVNIDDEYYLIDCTYDLGEGDKMFFLTKDLYKGNRTPFNFECNLPGYSSLEDEYSNLTKADSDTRNVVNTEEGITFSCDIYYQLNFNSADTIYTSINWEECEDKRIEDISREFTINTNAKICKIEYLSCSGSLITVTHDNNSIRIINYMHDQYVLKQIVYLEYEGQTYKIIFEKSGY